MIFESVSWTIAEKVLRIFTTLFVGIWVVRYLGPELYGKYSFAIATVGLLIPLSKMGLKQIAVQKLVQQPAEKDKILGTVFTLEVIGGLFVIPLSILLAFIFRPNDTFILVYVGIIAIAEVVNSFEVIGFWFDSQVQLKYTSAANVFAFTISNLLKLVLIFYQAKLIYFAAIYSIEFAFSSLALCILYSSKVGSILNWRFSYSYAQKLLKSSWPLIFSGFVIMIYMRSDQIMIAAILGDVEAGVYSAAVRISEMWYFVPIAIISSVTPSIIKSKQANQQIYYQRLGYLSTILVSISYVAAILITLFSSRIVEILFGDEYSGASPILSLHIWAGCFIVLGLVRSVFTVAEDLNHISLISTFVGAIINVVLNYIVIPIYGGAGAAMATLISQAFAAYFFSFFFRRTRKLFMLQTQSLVLKNLAEDLNLIKRKR